MILNIKSKLAAVTACIVVLTGCYSHSSSVLDDKNQTQLQQRSYQSRAFDTTNKAQTLRSVIATLQDLDFVIDKADNSLGTVSATKFTRNVPFQMTITVRPRGQKQVMVRANAQYGIRAVVDPKTYQDFFQSLSKSMFLDAQEIG